MKTISKAFWFLLILMLAGCSVEPSDSGTAALSSETVRRGGPAVPLPPTLLSPINGATGIALVPYPVLQWNPSSGATAYRAQISDNPAFNNLLADNQGLTGYMVVAYIPLRSNTTYYWRVNASNKRSTSSWSSVSRFTTTTLTAPAGIPVLVSPVDGAENVSLHPTLVWLPVEGDVTYEVQVSGQSVFQVNAFHWTGITGTSITINDDSLIEAITTRFYWRVRARNIAGAGPWSAVNGFTTVSFF